MLFPWRIYLLEQKHGKFCWEDPQENGEVSKEPDNNEGYGKNKLRKVEETGDR